MFTVRRVKLGILSFAFVCIASWVMGIGQEFVAAASDGIEDKYPAAIGYWAYKRVQKPTVPAVRSRAWVKTEVDAFILKELESKGIRPAPPADKITLLRRATFDLTGLPPTPQEVQAYLSDNSPKAFERVIDRLLASPHYGEKWARHWLDRARYAESEGFKNDETRPTAWRYRDYVIKSFHQDKPYHRFGREQIPGDEL